MREGYSFTMSKLVAEDAIIVLPGTLAIAQFRNVGCACYFLITDSYKSIEIR